MREPVINEEGVLVLGSLALLQVMHDLLPMPMAACLVGAAAAGSVLADREELVCRVVAVSVLACTHGIVARTIEYRWQSGLGQIGRHHLRVGNMRVHDAPRLVRNVPDGSARHDHVTGRRAYSSHPGTHVISPVQNHALLGQAVDVGCVENGAGVVYLQVERGLVVHNDEKEIRTLSAEKTMAQKAGKG